MMADVRRVMMFLGDLFILGRLSREIYRRMKVGRDNQDTTHGAQDYTTSRQSIACTTPAGELCKTTATIIS
jgi:hypothetical protein